MSSNNPQDRKSEELRDSELDNVAGGAGGHPGHKWEPHMGDTELGKNPDDPQQDQGPIHPEDHDGQPKDGSIG